MKSYAILKSVYKDCLVLIGDQLLPPAVPAARGFDKPKKKAQAKYVNKTSWIDDDRNIMNEDGAMDIFMRLVKIELDFDVWPEFYFSTERAYRFDNAIPVDADGQYTWHRSKDFNTVIQDIVNYRRS